MTIDVHTAVGAATLFLLLWMIGVWTEDLHTPITGIHTLASVLAGTSCLLCVATCWVAVRAWLLQRPH